MDKFNRPSRSWQSHFASFLKHNRGDVNATLARAPSVELRQKPLTLPWLSIVDHQVINKVLDKMIRDKRRTLLLGSRHADEGTVNITQRIGAHLRLRRDCEASHGTRDPSSRANLVCPTRFGTVMFTLDDLLLETDDGLLAKKPGLMFVIRHRGLYRQASLDQPGEQVKLFLPNLPGPNKIIEMPRLQSDGASLLMTIGLSPQKTMFNRAKLHLGDLVVEVPRVYPAYLKRLSTDLWHVELSFGGINRLDALVLQQFLSRQAGQRADQAKEHALQASLSRIAEPA